MLNLYTDKDVPAHQVTLVPEVGKPAHIIAPNIYVRKATLQGINGVLTPYGIKIGTSSGPGRRLLKRGGGSGGRFSIARDSARYWSSMNTYQAVVASANRRPPAGFSPNSASRQAAFGADGCFNCDRWGNEVGY